MENQGNVIVIKDWNQFGSIKDVYDEETIESLKRYNINVEFDVDDIRGCSLIGKVEDFRKWFSQWYESSEIDVIIKYRDLGGYSNGDYDEECQSKEELEKEIEELKKKIEELKRR